MKFPTQSDDHLQNSSTSYHSPLKMQNADSTVSSPVPSAHGSKRKRTGSLTGGYVQGGRPKKVPHDIMPDFDDQDVEMEDAQDVTPPPIDAAIRVNGASTVTGAAAIAAATKALSDSDEWQKTIERIVKSVVSIRFCQVRICRSGQEVLMNRFLLSILYQSWF